MTLKLANIQQICREGLLKKGKPNLLPPAWCIATTVLAKMLWCIRNIVTVFCGCVFMYLFLIFVSCVKTRSERDHKAEKPRPTDHHTLLTSLLQKKQCPAYLGIHQMCYKCMMLLLMSAQCVIWKEQRSRIDRQEEIHIWTVRLLHDYMMKPVMCLFIHVSMRSQTAARDRQLVRAGVEI